MGTHGIGACESESGVQAETQSKGNGEDGAQIDGKKPQSKEAESKSAPD